MKRAGRGWAYVCAILGGAASIAANVAHSYVPPAAAPTGWQPATGAVISAVFWPLALLAAIEAFARVAWPPGRRWVVLRFGGLIPVALVAAVVSYLHLSGLLASYRAGWFEVHVGPLAVDGLMVIGTAALIATSRSRQADQAATRNHQLDQESDQVEHAASLVAEWSPPTSLAPTEWREAPTPWIYADELAADHTPDQPDQTDPEPDQVEERPRPDADLVAEFGDQLRELVGAGKLSRYQVEQVTGASRRQAERILGALLGETDQAGDQTDQSPNGGRPYVTSAKE